MARQRSTIGRRPLLAAGAAAIAAPGLALGRGLAGPARLAEGFEQLHALVVSRDGAELLAEAFRGPSVDRPVNVKSVSKTLVAALTGAAIDRGEVAGLEATLGALIPDLIPREADPRVAALQLENLVTMQAGLERTSGPNYGAWVSSPNWVRYALSRPFVAQPGGRMLYSTGSFHVLGVALARATGQSLLAQARGRLGDPLEIEIPPWVRDPQGHYLGGNEMALSPRAMLRFGEMVRDGGQWQGRRVLDQDWIAASLVPRTRSPWSGLSYGYGWFLGSAADTRIALARGYGGQVICIAPDRGMTIAITSDPTRPARSGGYFGDLMELIGDIVSAA